MKKRERKENLTETILVRLRPSELKKAQRKADNYKIGKSTYLRWLLQDAK